MFIIPLIVVNLIHCKSFFSQQLWSPNNKEAPLPLHFSSLFDEGALLQHRNIISQHKGILSFLFIEFYVKFINKIVDEPRCFNLFYYFFGP